MPTPLLHNNRRACDASTRIASPHRYEERRPTHPSAVRLRKARRSVVGLSSDATIVATSRPASPAAATPIPTVAAFAAAAFAAAADPTAGFTATLAVAKRSSKAGAPAAAVSAVSAAAAPSPCDAPAPAPDAVATAAGTTRNATHPASTPVPHGLSATAEPAVATYTPSHATLAAAAAAPAYALAGTAATLALFEPRKVRSLLFGPHPPLPPALGSAWLASTAAEWLGVLGRP